MKFYNLKHEITITTDLEPIAKNLKSGEETEHKRVVTQLSFYNYIGEHRYAPVYLTKDTIIDLYNQILEIEKEVILKQYFEPLF